MKNIDPTLLKRRGHYLRKSAVTESCNSAHLRHCSPQSLKLSDFIVSSAKSFPWPRQSMFVHSGDCTGTTAGIVFKFAPFAIMRESHFFTSLVVFSNRLYGRRTVTVRAGQQFKFGSLAFSCYSLTRAQSEPDDRRSGPGEKEK